MKRTISFYCKRCGGRMLEEEIYWEPRNFGDNKKIKKVEVTCMLCARSGRCEYKDYKHLLKEIERVITRNEARKNHEKSVLSK